MPWPIYYQVQNSVLQWYKLFRFASYRAFGFWSAIAFITDALLFTAFLLRMSGLSATSSQAEYYRFKSFQVLSFVAPFIWYVHRSLNISNSHW